MFVDPHNPPPELLPVEVISDGTAHGTEIRVNGVSVANVTSLRYEITAEGWGQLTIVSSGGPLLFKGNAEIIEEQP